MKRRWRWNATLVLSVTVALVGLCPVPASGAQDQNLDPELSSTAAEFARHWAGGSADSLAAVLAPGGIRLHLDGPARSATPSRQAVAAIRDFLRAFDEAEAQVTRAAVAGGTEDQGFVEMIWTARKAGTSQVVRYTLFLSLSRLDDRWRVEEIRLLR